MERGLATFAAWMSVASTWLQDTTGMTIKDLALFTGGILIVIAVLCLGIYSGKPRYREAARFGWWLLLIAAAFLAWGLYDPGPPVA